MHHQLSKRYVDHPSSKLMFIPLARHGPTITAPYLELFDDLQAWLIRHYVCLRHREHQLFHEFERDALPERFTVGRDSPGDRPVMAAEAVGMVGWVLPHVAIIDVLGLNDRVVAHYGATSSFRRMAHERIPPPGYVECFRPNVALEPGRVLLEPRAKPLSAAEIRACEASFEK
jgi:arabinofuranosyltransferase